MVSVSLFRKFCVDETKFSIPQSADADERDDVGIVPYKYEICRVNGTMWASSPTNTKWIVALKSMLELIYFRCKTDRTHPTAYFVYSEWCVLSVDVWLYAIRRSALKTTAHLFKLKCTCV